MVQATDDTATVKAGGRVYFARILALALVLRLAIAVLVLVKSKGVWPFNLVGELGFVAQSLLAGHGFSSPFGGSTGPTAFLAPGYPVLIAVIFRLFGVFTTASAIAVMLVHTLFGLCAIFLIMKVAAQEFGATAANASGVFWAVGLPYIWLPEIFWDTSITVLFVIAAIALALRCARAPTRATWALMGIFGGCVLLVNPSLLLMLLMVFGWTVFQTRGSGYSGPLLSAVLLLAIFAPWPIRNGRALHAFIPLRSNFGFELWKGNRPGVAAAVDDSSLYPYWDRREYASYATKGEVVFMRDKTALAKQNIAAHRGEFVRLCGERFVQYWTGLNEPSTALAAFSLLTTLFGAVGLVWLVKDGRYSLALLLFLPLLVFPLPYYITHAEMRFRIVMEPITTLLSSYAVVKLVAAFQRRRNAA